MEDRSPPMSDQSGDAPRKLQRVFADPEDSDVDLAREAPMLREAAGVFWTLWMIGASILASSSVLWLVSLPRGGVGSFREFCEIVGFGVIALCVGAGASASIARAQLFGIAKLIDQKRTVARRHMAVPSAAASAELLIELEQVKNAREGER